jgi:hypothetical protein
MLCHQPELTLIYQYLIVVLGRVYEAKSKKEKLISKNTTL